MKEINFLPPAHARKVRVGKARSRQVWWMTLVVGSLAFVTFTQRVMLTFAHQELARLTGPISHGFEMQEELADSDRELASELEQAEAILRIHESPPDTILLSAIATSIPPDAALSDLKFERKQDLSRSASPKPSPPTQTQVQSNSLSSQSPANPKSPNGLIAHDLEVFEGSVRTGAPIVTILGHAKRSSDVYRFMDGLKKSRQFDRLRLESLDQSRRDGSEPIRFQITCVAGLSEDGSTNEDVSHSAGRGADDKGRSNSPLERRR